MSYRILLSCSYFYFQEVIYTSIINVTNLTFAYDGSYDNIFENVSFQIDTEWKLGFTGRNGRGKTTFLNLLLKKYEYSGTISSSVPFEYFPYEVTDKEQLTTDVISSVYYDFQQWQLMRELNLLQVSEDVLYRPFDTLSNGEQTKVLLAALFLKENSFLLIDEPTNHLDVNARKIVGDYLNSKKGFILVSHDRNFLDSCVDHILSINRNNIEIQRDDKGAGVKRARYNSSLIDANVTEPGEQYQNLNETYVVFITENDVLGENIPIYHVDRIVRETGKMFNDQSHIIYVNSQIKDETALGKLMHDFTCTNAKDMYYEVLADRVHYFKEDEKGVAIMCKAMEDMRNEAAREAEKMKAIRMARLMIEDGKLNYEDIAMYTELTLEEVEKIALEKKSA